MSNDENQQSTLFIEKNKVRKYFYFGSIFAIIFLVAIISINYLRSLETEYSNKIEQLSSAIIEEKKVFLKNSIEQVIYLIESEKKIFLSQNQFHDESGKPMDKEDIDLMFKDYIKPVIRNLRLVNNGYVWINEVIYYNGGEGYATRFVHPNLPETEGIFLSTETTDTAGNKPYQIELEGIKQRGELYYDYYFKEMGRETVSHKMSYAKLYEPYDWIVATGIYLNDVDQLVNNEKEKMHRTQNQQVFYSFMVALIVLIIVVIMLIFVEKQISRLINSYEKDITEYTKKILSEKKKTERALEEVKKLKGLFPICSQCKKIRDDQGYWNQIELYISSHSDASFSHSLCPSCAEQLYGEEPWYKELEGES